MILFHVLTEAIAMLFIVLTLAEAILLYVFTFAGPEPPPVDGDMDTIMANTEVPSHCIECDPAGVFGPLESPYEARADPLVGKRFVVPVPAVAGPDAPLREADTSQQLSALVVVDRVKLTAALPLTIESG